MIIFLKFYSRRFFLFSLIFLFSLLLSINTYADTWEDPSQDPPGGNIEPPINQGTTPQTKKGKFTIGSGTPGSSDYLTVFGPSKFEGVNITQDLTVGEKVSILAKSGNLMVKGQSTLSSTTIIGTFGIGTDDPKNEMHIKNSSGPIINLQGPTTNYRGLRIAKSDTDNAEKWFVGANGNNDFVIRLTTSNLNAFTFSSTTGSIQLGQDSLKNCSTTKAITTNAIGELVCGKVSGTGGSLSGGVSSTIPIWTSPSTIGNSNIYQGSGGYIGIGTTTPDSMLNIKLIGNVEGIRVITGDYSPFIIRNTSNNDDFFRVRQTGKVEIKGLANCSSISTNANGELSCGSGSGKYVGVSASTTGNNSNYGFGYAVANNICSTTPGILGSHVCTTNEMLNTIIVGGTMPNNGTILWIFNGPPGYHATKSNDCDGRTNSAANVYGAVWHKISTYPNGRGMISQCDSIIPFACCK